MDENTKLIEGAKMNSTDMSRSFLLSYIRCKIKDVKDVTKI